MYTRVYMYMYIYIYPRYIPVIIARYIHSCIYQTPPTSAGGSPPCTPAGITLGRIGESTCHERRISPTIYHTLFKYTHIILIYTYIHVMCIYKYVYIYIQI